MISGWIHGCGIMNTEEPQIWRADYKLYSDFQLHRKLAPWHPCSRVNYTFKKTFSVRQVYWQHSSLIFFLRKSISPSLLKDNFRGYNILDWWGFSSQYFKYFTPLSSCLLCCSGEVRYNSHIISSINKVFFPLWILSKFFLYLWPSVVWIQ